MQKLFTLSISILFGTVFSSAYAQNIYGSGSNSAGSATQSSHVMTNDQFKSRVDSLGKQTKDSVSQQVDDKLKSGAPATSTLPAAPPGDDQTSQTGQTPPAPLGQQPAASSSTTQPAASSSKGSNPAGTSSQSYSGFGTGQTNQKNTPSDGSSKSGSSWNVGY